MSLDLRKKIQPLQITTDSVVSKVFTNCSMNLTMLGNHFLFIFGSSSEVLTQHYWLRVAERYYLLVAVTPEFNSILSRRAASSVQLFL